MPAARNEEPVVRRSTPMPAGYVFVPKGNVYMTVNCRKKTQAADQTVYAVVDKNKRAVGIRVPASVRDTVAESEATTREDRASAVQKRDDSLELNFRRAVKKLFPDAPDGEVPQVVARAMKKGSGRVGRTSKIDVETRASLAVQAHVRHCHTDYDKRLKQGESRWEVRDAISKQINEILHSWRGSALPAHVAHVNKDKSAKAGLSGTEETEKDESTAHVLHATKSDARGPVRGPGPSRAVKSKRRKARKARKAIREAKEWENSTKTTVTLRSGRNMADAPNRAKSPPSPKERRITKLRTRQSRRISGMAAEPASLSHNGIGHSLKDDVSDLEESDDYGGAGKDKVIWISSDEEDSD